MPSITLLEMNNQINQEGTNKKNPINYNISYI